MLLKVRPFDGKHPAGFTGCDVPPNGIRQAEATHRSRPLWNIPGPLLPWVYFLIIVCLNVWICRGAFRAEYTGHWDSVQGGWIALARLAEFDKIRPAWWPYWGAGAPLEATYAPLVPASIAAIARLGPYSYAQAFQILGGVVYCLGPALLYLVSWRGFHAPNYGFATALAYSLLSPAQLIVPDSVFASPTVWSARRLDLTFAWDEVPHLLSLALLPLSVWRLAVALQSRKLRDFVLSSLVFAAMMTASRIGLVLSVIVALTVPLAMPRRFRPAVVSRSLLLVAAAYVLICPWLPPSVLFRIPINAASAIDGQPFSHPFVALAAVTAAAFVTWWISGSSVKGWPLRWLLLFGCPMILIPCLARYPGWQFTPGPDRYKLEMEAVFAAGIGFAFRLLWRRLPPVARAISGGVIVLLAVHQAAFYRNHADELNRPIAIERTTDYQCALWLDTNLHGQRVMTIGPLSNWLNVFADNPQVSGQPYTTAPNRVQQAAVDAIRNGPAALSLLWLKAFGARALVVTGAQGAATQERFEGLAPVLWREPDASILEVSNRTSPLVHVISREALVKHPPLSETGLDELKRYVDAIDNPGVAPPMVRWRDASRALVTASVFPGEIIATQITYHAGWRATVDGDPRATASDGLGFLIVDPQCSGTCLVEFYYDGGVESQVCRSASLLVICLFAATALLRRAGIA